MKNITQVLHKKHTHLERLCDEIKVLRIAAKILSAEEGGTPVSFIPDIGESTEAMGVPGKQYKSVWP